MSMEEVHEGSVGEASLLSATRPVRRRRPAVGGSRRRRPPARRRERRRRGGRRGCATLSSAAVVDLGDDGHVAGPSEDDAGVGRRYVGVPGGEPADAGGEEHGDHTQYDERRRPPLPHDGEVTRLVRPPPRAAGGPGASGKRPCPVGHRGCVRPPRSRSRSRTRPPPPARTSGVSRLSTSAASTRATARSAGPRSAVGRSSSASGTVDARPPAPAPRSARGMACRLWATAVTLAEDVRRGPMPSPSRGTRNARDA